MSGNNSAVECNLAKVEVAGSNPVSRSKFFMKKKELLTNLRNQFNHQDKVLITIDPDPDAIASALAIKKLLRKYVTSITIACVKPIKRWNNIVMVKLLKIPMVDINTIDPKDYNKFVLLDAQPHHNSIFSRISYNVVIDHHPLPDKSECPKPSNSKFVDIRPCYGSTSSILTEYIKAARIKPSKQLATALAYGIKTDTRNFERQTTEEDIRAFLFLYHFVDKHALTKIEISDLSLEDLEFFERAIKNKKVFKNKIFAFVGSVPSHDILVILSEFFLKVHNIYFDIVAGIVDNSLVIVGRSDGKINIGNTLKEVFGKIGSAGGHPSMGRAEIPCENVKKLLEVDTLTEETIEKFIISTVLRQWKWKK